MEELFLRYYDEHYDEYLEVEDGKNHAFPWGTQWPILKYKIIDADEVFSIRRRFANRTPYLKRLTDKELKPAYEEYITPTVDSIKNAVPKYDPLKDFIETPLPKEPGYFELINIDLNNNRSILRFANKHGLLGILFHRYNFFPIIFPNQNNAEATKALTVTDGNNDQDCENELYIPQSVSFEYMHEETFDTLNVQVDSDDALGLWMGYSNQGAGFYPLEIKAINDSYFPLKSDPYTSPLVLNESATSFLQHLVKSNKSINTDSLFYLYSEPLDLVKKEIKLFQAAYEKAALINQREVDKDMLTISSFELSGALKQNLKNVYPQPHFKDDKEMLTFGWHVPSLLSAYYLMLYLDVTGNRKARYCKYRKCMRPFIAERKDNVYCSHRCQDSAKKDRRRHPELYSSE